MGSVDLTFNSPDLAGGLDRKPLRPTSIYAWSGSLWLPVKCDSTGAIASGGTSTSPVEPVTSTAAEGSHVFKNAAGTLYSLSVVVGAVSGWLMLFDATSAPANGAVTPLGVWPVASDGTSGFFQVPINVPWSFATGITAVFSSTGPYTKTTSATATFSAQTA